MLRRVKRLEQAVLATAAEFFNRESNRSSLITVTSATIGNGGRTAQIHLSVLPKEAGPHALLFALRKRTEFREFLGTRIRTRELPHIDFVLD